MFDETPTQSKQAPANLPVGQPPIPPAPYAGAMSGGMSAPARPQPSAEPEDILGDIDIPTPPAKMPDLVRSATPPPAIRPPERATTKEPFFKAHKTAFALIIALLIISAIGFAAWYGYTLFMAPAAPIVTNQATQPTNQQPVVNQNDITNQQPTDQVNTNTTPEPPAPMDTDRDGLDDSEEALYGTNKDMVDTDQDGLTDRDEVKVFKSDPNNPDTDNDGFLDGQEVRGGYDPIGPGRLLEIPQQ